MRRSCVSKIGVSVLLICMWGMSSALAFGNVQNTFINKKYFKSDVIFDFTIMGSSIATKDQCIKYLLKRNPLPLITTTPKKLVDYYYLEAGLEGIRPDIAFAQALHETGNFRYGGDVIPLQNNYCGLGTTGNGVKGAWFDSAEIGVRAQIQHLLAYTTKRPPIMSIVDPRYNLVKSTDKFGQSSTWTDLNGKWAVPGKTYGQMILKIHEKILMEK